MEVKGTSSLKIRQNLFIQLSKHLIVEIHDEEKHLMPHKLKAVSRDQ